MDKDVTIVIPAKDEAETIQAIVTKCLAHSDAVLVIDGCSGDDTAALAKDAGAHVISDNGIGKGAALRQAISHIDTDIAVFIDADGSHTTTDIPKLIAPIRSGEADHVSASRLLGGSSELHGGFDEFFRLAGSAFITACINRRFKTRLSDSQNGFRAFRTSKLRALNLQETITTIEQEMIIKTLRKGIRLTEVASHESARQHGHSHINIWRVAPRYVYSLIKYLFF